MAPTKSPKRASFSLLSSPFTKEQVSWTILKYGEVRNIKKVQRAFRLRFCPQRPKDTPNYMAFKRLVDRFETDGGQTRPKTPPGKATVTQQDIEAVEQFFTMNKKAHLREAARELGMSKTKVWKILRKDMKWRAYKPHTSHILTKAQMKARLECSEWFSPTTKTSLPRKFCLVMRNILC